MITTCNNCNKKFIGHYCNYCGQSADTHDINYSYLWHEIQHGLFHVDKGMIYTTKELFTRPGHTIKEYISGKRVKHFKPVAYVLILSTIYALSAHFLKVKAAFDVISLNLTSDKKEKSNEMVHIINNSVTWFKEHYAYSTLLLLPIISFSSYLAFRKSDYNYLKHLILNCYIAGQRMIVFILILPILAICKNKEVISRIESLETLIWVSLMMWTYIQFFDKNKIFKNISLTLLSYLFMLIQLIILLILAGVTLSLIFK